MITDIFKYIALILVWLLELIFSSSAQTQGLRQADSALKNTANTAFQAQDWHTAANAYQAIVKSEVTSGMAWFRLGTALQNTGSHKEAVKPYQEALRLGFQTTTATFRLARVYAVLRQSDQALAELEKAIKLGYATTREGFAIEPDFDNIRSLPRFDDIIKLAEASICATCNGQPEYRQFDFWVGEWDVRPFATPNAVPIARSIIERTNGNCTIVENYYTKGSYTGKSFNIYDASAKKWRQFWNDNFGQVIQFEGEYDAEEKALKYRSESSNRQGQKVLGKMTFYNLAPDKVRQLWESSTDDGKTWTSSFDGLYTRRK